MAVEQETWQRDHYELAVQEAENILDSYIEQESYASQVPSTELETGELEDKIRQAVDEIQFNDGYDKHAKMLMASGAVAGSAGAIGLLMGSPVGAASLVVSGCNYFAARNRSSTSEVEELETKAFLQDALREDLSVDGTENGYRIEFEYNNRNLD